jgi:hypothetical protein
MTDPVTVTIGGETIELPPVLHFDELERIWPAMKALDATADPIERTAARLAIISGALKGTKPELTVPELKKRLRVAGYDEIGGLVEPVNDLLVASGLMKRADPGPAGEPGGDGQPGEVTPGEAAPPGSSPAASPTSTT